MNWHHCAHIGGQSNGAHLLRSFHLIFSCLVHSVIFCVVSLSLFASSVTAIDCRRRVLTFFAQYAVIKSRVVFFSAIQTNQRYRETSRMSNGQESLYKVRWKKKPVKTTNQTKSKKHQHETKDPNRPKTKLKIIPAVYSRKSTQYISKRRMSSSGRRFSLPQLKNHQDNVSYCEGTKLPVNKNALVLIRPVGAILFSVFSVFAAEFLRLPIEQNVVLPHCVTFRLCLFACSCYNDSKHEISCSFISNMLPCLVNFHLTSRRDPHFDSFSL